MGNELYQGMEVHVFERLKFSYDCLPNNIMQSCFLYCSLFPEDFKILKDDLVHYCAAEKYCGRNTEGYNIVYTLIRRCLLEEEGEYVKMHDVVRNMALYITSKCEKEKHMFFSQAGAQLIQLPVMEEWEGATKVSFMENDVTSIEESPRCCHLVTLFLSHNVQLRTISGGFFQYMTRLTVLDLSYTKIRVFPLGITDLQSIEYLNLSVTRLKTLPIQMKCLMRLKYLILKHTFSLEMIPVGVLSNLSKLQVLNIFMCCGIEPYRRVGNNVLTKDGNKLMKELICLKNISELSLSVRSITFYQAICSNQILLNSVSAVQLHFFKTKSLNILPLANSKNLRSLDIVNNDLEEIIMERRDTKAPGCCHNNDLLIFHGLREVDVSYDKSMRHITWLVFAPHLTILRALGNDNMKEVISAEKLSEYQSRGERLNLFPKLKFLELKTLRKIKTICPEALSFPCLTQIMINKCPALKKLPLNSRSAQGCDVMIREEESWWNELTWEDDETQAAFSSCFQKW